MGGAELDFIRARCEMAIRAILSQHGTPVEAVEAVIQEVDVLASYVDREGTESASGDEDF